MTIRFPGGQQSILPTTTEETSTSSPNTSIVATTSTPVADMQPVAAHYQQVDTLPIPSLNALPLSFPYPLSDFLSPNQLVIVLYSSASPHDV